MYKYFYQSYENSDQYVEEILQQAKINKEDVQTDADDFLLVFNLLWEAHQLDEIEIYQNLFDSLHKKKIKTILIINSFYKDLDLSMLNTKIYFVDYFLWRTFDKVVNQKKCDHNTEWNMNAEKFLFLTGKPQYHNRVRLLYKIIAGDLINRCIWSFFMREETQDKCRSLLSDISDDEFQMLFKYYNNPDNVKIMFEKDNQSLHYGGIPYDVQLFRDCLFRVVAETQCDPEYTTQHQPWPMVDYQPWLTEKTWITILNKMPFILAGDNGSLDKLKKMGFKTFEEFLPIQDYDQIQNSEHKLDAIIKNTSYWLDEMPDKSQINADVEHNYKNFLGIAMQNKKVLEDICLLHGMNINKIDEICTTYDIMGNE